MTRVLRITWQLSLFLFPSLAFLNGKSNKTKYTFLTRSKSGPNQTTSWDHKKLTQINETKPQQKKIHKHRCVRNWEFSRLKTVREQQSDDNILGTCGERCAILGIKLNKRKGVEEPTWLRKWNWEGTLSINDDDDLVRCLLIRICINKYKGGSIWIWNELGGNVYNRKPHSH